MTPFILMSYSGKPIYLHYSLTHNFLPLSQETEKITNTTCY